jgi:hypothetical protein
MQRCINKFEPQRNAASRHDPARRQSYRITNNKLYNNKQKNFTGLANGGMRVANEEFVATLRGNMFVMDSATQGGRLAVHKLPINPGDGRMFPWLSAVARRYEHYSFKKLEILYKPAVSTYVSGNVAMCPIYDPADSTPTSRTVLLNTDGVVRTQVYKSGVLSIPASRLNSQTKHYIRSQGDHVLDPGELRNTDLGFVVLTVTDGGGALANWEAYGDVFVRYVVELHGPRIGSAGTRVGVSHTKYNNRQWHLAPGSITAPFGNIPSLDNTEWTKNHNNAKNTLDYEIGFDNETYQYGGTADGAASIVKFNEPFTGLMTITRSHPGTTGTMQPHVVNGWIGAEHDGSGPTDIGMPTRPGKTARWRKGIVEFVSLVKDAGNAVKETWSIICDVGDIIAVSGLGAPSATEDTALTFLEAAEEMLPVFAGLLV